MGVIYRLVIDGKKDKTYPRSRCTDISWRLKCARGTCEAVPDCTRASLVHVHVKEEEWEVIYRLVIDGKKNKTYPRSLCTDISWRLKCARGMCEAVPDCTRASLVHVHVKRKSGRLFIDLSIIRERAKRTRAHFERLFFLR